MTTNQTIDGVPRELLEAFAAYVADSPNAIMRARAKELRALLDAPTVEPVPITDDMNRLMVAYKNGEFGLEDGSETVEALSVASFDAVESHGHDADSYMAGYCAAMYEQIKPFLWLALHTRATQPQGEPVAWIKPDVAKTLTKDECCYAFGSQNPKGTLIPLYAEQPAPVAVVLPDRSPESYAIEHAEYMAKSADDVLAKFQAYGLALLAVDEGGDDGEGELFEAIDSARGDLQEALVDLRSMVYEFRKRAAKSR